MYNKVDQISIEEVDRLARKPNSVVIRSDISMLSHFAANVQFFMRAEAHQRCYFFCPCVNLSCGMKLNLDYLLEQLWEYLALICIYTKKRGGTHDYFSLAPVKMIIFT